VFYLIVMFTHGRQCYHQLRRMVGQM
ncbi:hypothetical protein A5804_002883, partial [Enterococcus faecium]